MRKIRMLLVAVLAAMPLALVTASPAHACKQYPCPARCDVNPPLSGRPLIECYY